MNQHQLDTLRNNNEESREFVKSCFRGALMIILKDKKEEKFTQGIPLVAMNNLRAKFRQNLVKFLLWWDSQPETRDFL